MGLKQYNNAGITGMPDLVESVLTFNIVVWYGNLGVKGKAKLARIVGMAGKINGAK